MLSRVTLLIVAMFSMAAFAQEPPAPKDEAIAPDAPKKEIVNEEEAMMAEFTNAFRDVRGQLVAVFGEERVPHLEGTVFKDDDPEVNFVFEWAPIVKDDFSNIGVIVGRERLKDKVQVTYDLAHVVMITTKPELPKELFVREPIALLSAVGVEPNLGFGKFLNARGGPLTVEELMTYYAAEKPEEKQTDEDKAIVAKFKQAAQATNYLLGLDLHRSGHLKDFLEGKISGEELKAKIDPAAAWKRRKECMVPKPRREPRVPINPANVG